MLQFGNIVCNKLKNYSGKDQYGQPIGLNDTYYDGEWVFFQIADYTGNSLWFDCAAASRKIYRDEYIISNNGGLPGYWLFPNGIFESFRRNGDGQSLEAYKMLLSNGAYVPATGFNTNGNSTTPGQSNWVYMRETAYALNVVSFADRFGVDSNTRFDALVPEAPPLDSNHIGQTIAGRKAELLTLSIGQLNQSYVTMIADYRKPFMTALAAWSLISNASDDPRVLQALKAAADWMWTNLWDAPSQSMLYVDVPQPGDTGRVPAPDLNLLIAPMYYWIYSQTHDIKYLTEGDALFNGGVAFTGTLNDGKQFSQNYRWSIQGLKYRGN